MSQSKHRWMTLAIFLATLVTAIEATIVTTATHTIATALHASQLTTLIFTTYLFASALITPIVGHLADAWGPKRLFQAGMLLFLVGTISCGMATTAWILLGARVIQGLGAGTIMAMLLTMIGALYPPEKRSHIIGMNNAAWGLAALVAPVIGGAILAVSSWHWLFFINVPIGLFVLLIVQSAYPRLQATQHVTLAVIKPLSQLTLILLAVLIGIEQLAHSGVGIVFICLGLLWLRHWYRLQQQSGTVLPIKPLAHASFRASISTVFLLNGALIGFQVYLPLWLQVMQQQTPTAAGLALLPSSALFILSGYGVSHWRRRFSDQRILAVSLSLGASGFLGLCGLSVHTTYGLLLLLSALIGASLGSAVTLSIISAQGDADAGNLGTVSAFISLCRTLGQSTMITLLGVIYHFGHTASVGFMLVYGLVTALFILLLWIHRQNAHQPLKA